MQQDKSEQTADGTTAGSAALSSYPELEAALKNVVCTMQTSEFTLYQHYRVETPKGIKKTGRKIGSFSRYDDRRECKFTDEFLLEHPEFLNFYVYYVGQGKFFFEKRPDDEALRAEHRALAEAAKLRNADQQKRKRNKPERKTGRKSGSSAGTQTAPGSSGGKAVKKESAKARAQKAAAAARAHEAEFARRRAEEARHIAATVPRKYGAIRVLRSFFESSRDGKFLMQHLDEKRFEELFLVLAASLLHGWDFIENQCGLVLLQHTGFKLDKFKLNDLLKLFDYLQDHKILEKLYQYKTRQMCRPGFAGASGQNALQPLALYARTELKPPAEQQEENSGQAESSVQAENSCPAEPEIQNLFTVLDAGSGEFCQAAAWKDKKDADQVEKIGNLCRRCGSLGGGMADPLLVTAWRPHDDVRAFNELLRQDCSFILGFRQSVTVPGHLRSVIAKNALELAEFNGECIWNPENGLPQFYGRTQVVEWSYPLQSGSGGRAKKRTKLYLHVFLYFPGLQSASDRIHSDLMLLNMYYTLGRFSGGSCDEAELERFKWLFDWNLVRLDKRQKIYVLNSGNVRIMQHLMASYVVVSNSVSVLRQAWVLFSNAVMFAELREKLSSHFAFDDPSFASQLSTLSLGLAERLMFSSSSPWTDYGIKLSKLHDMLNDLDEVMAVQDFDSGLIKVQRPIPERSRVVLESLGISI